MTNSEFWTRRASVPNPGVNRAGAQMFDRVFLKATRLIKAGHEIYVDYGDDFWKRHSLT